MKKALFVVLGIVLIGIIVWLIASIGEDKSARTEDMSRDLIGIDAPYDWNRYESAERGFTFFYPDDAVISHEAGRVKVSLIGPLSEPATEIADGFTLYVRTLERGESTLSKIAQRRADEERARVGLTKELADMSVGGHEVKAFTSASELEGYEVTYAIFELGEMTIEASYTLKDPRDVGYGETIERIIGTLQTR